MLLSYSAYTECSHSQEISDAQINTKAPDCPAGFAGYIALGVKVMIAPDVLRSLLIESLEYFASSKKAREYQRRVPIAHVPDELFCQWDEYIPNDPVLPQAFAPQEIEALATFHKEFEDACQATPNKLPDLDAYLALPAIQHLARCAEQALAVFKVAAQPVDPGATAR